MQEQGQERNEEHEEDTNNAVLDPVEDREQVVASVLAAEEVALGRVLADLELLVQRAQEHHCGKASATANGQPKSSTYSLQ